LQRLFHFRFPHNIEIVFDFYRVNLSIVTVLLVAAVEGNGFYVCIDFNTAGICFCKLKKVLQWQIEVKQGL